MGTVAPYSQQVPKSKWSPPDDETGRQIAARMRASKARYEEIDAIMAQVKEDVIALAAANVPVITLSELYGVQRKTIYRWMGQEMS